MSEDKGAPVGRVGLTAAPHKQRALEFVGRLVQALLARGCEVVVDEQAAGGGGCSAAQVAPLTVCAQTDLLLALGGDGTLLRAARVVAPCGTPLLGVDLGSFGFLAEEDPDHLLGNLERLLAGDYMVEPRLLLQAQVNGATAEPGALALNDVVVMRRQSQHPVRLRTTLDGAHIATYPADGVIVATATGSTAYNLSAGGPILDSRMQALVITPICSHTLYSRPLVVPAEVAIGVRVESRGWGDEGVCVTADGQESTALGAGQELLIRRAPWAVRLVRLQPARFYDRLREKLRWGAER